MGQAYSISGFKSAALTVGLCLAAVHCSAATIHVSTAGDDSASGGAWSEAVRGVNRALERAVPGDEVWVAAGAYTNAVVMKPGVALLGGFRGTESARTERDPLTHQTILDGAGTNIVVLVEAGGPETIVDGFTIQNGLGAGVRVVNSGAVISRNRIRANLSRGYGAGISVRNLGTSDTATLRENVILDNYAFDGGGIACIDASPQIIGNTIAWNTAVQNGGGISCWRDASPLIENNAIFGNTASWVLDNAAVPIGGGGVFATADDLDGRPHPTARSSPTIRNNVIAANGAANGGGIALVDANGGVPSVINNTVVANSGSGIFWGSSALVPIAPIVVNNLVAFNPWGLEQTPGTPTNAVIESNCVFGNRVHTFGGDYRGLPDQTGTAGNLSVDPLLASVPFGNLHLQPGSPCRDAGKEMTFGPDAKDIDGEPRVRGAAIDIGADESNGASWKVAPKVVRVGTQGDDAADGASWSTAKRTVTAALDAIRPTGGEVWVEAGTYPGHFWLPAFVHLYGGFVGTETTRNARAPAEHPTILDGGGKPNVVVSGQGGFAVSTLDGFTVTGGGVFKGATNFNKYGLGGKGGGLLISVSSPVITNNVIRRNSLAYDNTTNFFVSYGAGIACELSYAVIGGNTIEENEILNDFDGSGGGIYCFKSMPLITGNRIAANQAKYGPAIYSWASSPLIVRNTIESNAMYVLMPAFFGAAEGAVSIHLADDALVDGNRIVGNTAGTGAGLYFSGYRAGQVQNNLFLSNHAYDPTAFGGMGGGLYVFVTTNATSAIRVVNNTLVSNVASNMFQEMGGGIAFTLFPPATNLVIANNLIVSNSSGIYQTPTSPMPNPLLSQNNVFNPHDNYLGLAPGSTDRSQPVQFLNPLAGDYRLAAGSPEIDAADLEFAALWDATGVPRPLDGDADGRSAADVGAFEFVHPTADTDRDGLPDSWEVAENLDPTRDDSRLDPDGDGASNAHEYAAGTNPMDSDSVLRVWVARLAEDSLELRWYGVAGYVYDVERVSELGAVPGWAVQQQGLKGNGSELTVEVASQPDSTAFFRVRALPGAP
ncbi:MAG: right-handed parallel beta-helix repeat-containing protein [Verrucomicrobiia bacterium]